MQRPDSWIEIPKDSDFTLGNIPFGVFRTANKPPRCGTAIGTHVVDLLVLAEHGYFGSLPIPSSVFKAASLNAFIALGKQITNAARERLIQLFSKTHHELQDDKNLHALVLHRQEDVTMMMPVAAGDYTDFYSSREHATNVGALFRDPENALLPNWKHLPVAYHGRASSIVISGTPVVRPKGQFKPKDADVPSFGPTQKLDYELELAFVIGKNSTLGEPIPADKAEEYIFGFLLFNDWSARDIQSWEYVPLGPFLSKNFMSTVSPWIVTLEALAPFRTGGPEQDVRVLPYLQTKGDRNFDIGLEIDIQGESVCHTNTKYLYWNVSQQLAHHTVNGCNVHIGDIMASGTISGPTQESTGSLLERTRNGRDPLPLRNGTTRTFLQDGDTVAFKGFAERNGLRVGFGICEGKIKPAK